MDDAWKFFIFAITIIILSVVILTIMGSILNHLNHITGDSCTNQQDYKSAKKKAAWTVGLVSAMAGLTLITVVGVIVYHYNKRVPIMPMVQGSSLFSQ